ncbi:hypothetical protein P7K49_016463 [Saguinus oedipus]|uniref:Olduvai domain-containing protein n=1 Tax=Saguinus oedipus TaxID=9490 RepID=A0ABQ9VC62_SAGOE|nr:hypothetical protein P7K49_016463 [Saguinus oedipus]
MKNPLQMEDDPLEGSSNTQWHQVTGNIHGSSASKPKKTKIKVQFSNPVDNRDFTEVVREKTEIHGTTGNKADHEINRERKENDGKLDCDNHKYAIKSLEKDILLIGEETIYEEFCQIEELRQYKALAHCQTEQLAKLKYELQKVRDASCSLNHHSKAHLTPDDPDKSQCHSLREQLDKGPRLPEHYVSMLSPENDKDDEDDAEEEVEKVEKPAATRLSQELLEAKEQKSPEDPLDEIYWTPSVQGKLSDCHQSYSSALSSLENQLTCPALDVASSTQATCPQGTWNGDLSHHLSEVQASQTQLEPSTLVPSCLQTELDQGFHSGSGSARQGLSSTSYSFRVNADSGNQSFFQELVLTPLTAMKNPLQMEDDPLEGSSNTQWHQVTGNIHGASASKPKKMKRKVQLSKWIRWPSHSGCRGTK